MKSGSLTLVKVLNPAVYPEDEEFCVRFQAAGKTGRCFLLPRKFPLTISIKIKFNLIKLNLI